MPEKSLKLFVNYRRADEAVFVELLRTHFMFRYGRENVFMDFDSIPPFTRFEEYIKSKVRECDVLVAVIGPKWLELLKAKEASSEPDYVRIELIEALRLKKVIAPILIQGAKVPPDDQIPDDLRELFKLNIPPISQGRDVLENIDRLMDSFEYRLSEQGIIRTAEDLERTQDAAKVVQEHPSLEQLTSRFVEAFRSKDYPAALLWTEKMGEVGGVPERFGLEHRIETLHEKLKVVEEARHRHEVAAYLYSFVQHMVTLGDSPSEILDALNEVQEIEPNYDPEEIGVLMQVKATGLLPAPFEWCDIPAGHVLIAEKGEYEVKPFRMAKYPITNGQFNIFLNDPNGYGQAKWWNKSSSPPISANKIQQRRDLRQGFDGEKQPCIYVTWHEAMAFCRWLSDLSGETITLPTRVQWQYAAQGGDDHEFPWGNDFDSNRCNTRESGISRTTPVNQYPNGTSPFGVMDMAGNVWEWGLSPSGFPNGTDVFGERQLVMCGGAYDSDQRGVGCKQHTHSYTNMSYYTIGFRIISI